MGALLVDAPRVLIRRPEACTVLERGALIGVRRAAYDGPQLLELLHAIERVAPEHPTGLVSLTTLRLSPAFPLHVGFDADLSALADAARGVDRAVVAHATVLDFTGVRASAARLMGRAIWSLAKPRASMAFFSRLTDAVEWLTPHARAVGALDDLPTYVRRHRDAERILGPDDALPRTDPRRERSGE